MAILMMTGVNGVIFGVERWGRSQASVCSWRWEDKSDGFSMEEGDDGSVVKPIGCSDNGLG